MTPRKFSSRFTHGWVAALCAIVVGLVGCRNSTVRRADSLEARLRDQQASISQLSASLEQAETDRDIARREAAILRDELASLEPDSQVVHAAHTLARIDRIEVVPLLSGGLDRDEIPGDELISLLIAPKDSNGEIHRVQGSLSVQLRDISLPDDQQIVSRIDFDAAESDALWHNGIVGRGFRVVVPAPNARSNEELTAQIRFTDTSGQQFDTVYPLRLTPQPGPGNE